MRLPDARLEITFGARSLWVVAGKVLVVAKGVALLLRIDGGIGSRQGGQHIVKFKYQYIYICKFLASQPLSAAHAAAASSAATVVQLKALADTTRLAIIETLLGGSRTVTELVPITDRSQPAVSIALAKLLAANLVEQQRDGREMRYSLADAKRVKKLLEVLGSG
ncbi:hypothetical protein COY28_01240 [Candidatus Woesearchaeota archaeon CG_4_10_14_0_2_um_filter_57_5]|nr:MAG: hypothetical protein COY28_01240 [Candidatus Woesearchaeota archaeon CG_4_10_14_0_2_um_filter_57_5]